MRVARPPFGVDFIKSFDQCWAPPRRALQHVWIISTGAAALTSAHAFERYAGVAVGVVISSATRTGGPGSCRIASESSAFCIVADILVQFGIYLVETMYGSCNQLERSIKSIFERLKVAGKQNFEFYRLEITDSKIFCKKIPITFFFNFPMIEFRYNYRT